MRICIICGEEYEDSLPECPYCGYPIENAQEKQPSFPEEFMKRFSFMKPGDNRGIEQTWIFWDNEKQKTVTAGRLLKGEAGVQMAERLRTFRLHEDLELYPEILEIHDSGEEEEGYYIYEKLEGQSLGEMVERRNPLPESLVQSVEQSLKEICEKMKERELRHGDLNLNNILQSEGEVRIADFGNGVGDEPDISSVERISYRLRNGFWPDEEEESEEETRADNRKMILLGATVLAVAAAIAARIFL